MATWEGDKGVMEVTVLVFAQELLWVREVEEEEPKRMEIKPSAGVRLR